jgi:hypothetical protein
MAMITRGSYATSWRVVESEARLRGVEASRLRGAEAQGLSTPRSLDAATPRQDYNRREP